jgi:cytidine deaminase
MFQAVGAALRSVELGRQVGAALATPSGSVIALGANEVPAAGGGSYWEGDQEDAREYTRERDTNRLSQVEIAEEVEELLRERFKEVAKRLKKKGVRKVQPVFRKAFLEGLGEAVREGTRLREVTEYGRAVHAEMSALLDAARRGVSVQGATLFITVFPCHNCTRHIIEAGVRRVIFIEPYPKSRAFALHSDALDRPNKPMGGDPGKVSFEPFVGVAPRRYRELFDARWRERHGYLRRKDDDGYPIDFELERGTALPLVGDLSEEARYDGLPGYRYRERHVQWTVRALAKRKSLGLKPKSLKRLVRGGSVGGQ